ncbi:MAG TPA: type II toxin-antitoxin system Phd/YefM family antitoxin [Sphingomonas sp.]|nr:type II toxin-antitoxin system Phd/YefM family antitoxin [Sphingomonas sp.]
MRYSKQIKPISYLKANAAEVLKELRETGEPLIVTQNGEAKAVLQDIESYERLQETLAMLKIVAMGERDIRAGRTKPIEEVIDRLKAKHADRA